MKMKNIAFVLLVLSCAAVSKAGIAQTSQPSPEWKEKMHELESLLGEILLDVSSDDRFHSKKNFSRIQKNAEALAASAHDLEGGKIQSSDHDPSLKLISRAFTEEMRHAAQMLKDGHREYARSVLRAAPGYCISCHTRSPQGVQFTGLVESLEKSKLSDLEKADYLAAARRFDHALEIYQKVIQDNGLVEKYPLNWEKAIRHSLAITVRVKNDSSQTEKLIDQGLAVSNIPFYLREQLLSWRESVQKWKKEKPSKKLNQNALLKEALRLVALAQKRQKYPADRSGDIEYLRASAVVHQLLGVAKGETLTEALYLAGLCYDSLRGLNLWDLHEAYYLACIESSPHSDQSEKCFRHYQEGIFMGYTGSAGTSLPARVKSRLHEVEKKALKSSSKKSE